MGIFPKCSVAVVMRARLGDHENSQGRDEALRLTVGRPHWPLGFSWDPGTEGVGRGGRPCAHPWGCLLKGYLLTRLLVTCVGVIDHRAFGTSPAMGEAHRRGVDLMGALHTVLAPFLLYRRFPARPSSLRKEWGSEGWSLSRGGSGGHGQAGSGRQLNPGR